MNKIKEINKFLKILADIANQTNYSFDSDRIYYILTRYNIKKEDINFKINNMFDEWIKYFGSKSNIKVFVSENWKYFCQFVNYSDEKSKELINPIKMYISIDSAHIFESAKLIFDFMANNNITHLSKIGSDIRTDNIVIRVYSKDDAEKIHNFIKNNSYIRKGMNKVLPFSFEKDNIGYTLDGTISYNETLSMYLSCYINECKINNKLKNVSAGDFYNYIVDIYNKVFVNKINTDDFLEKFNKRNANYSKAFLLSNYQEVTKIILENLTSNSFQIFNSFLEKFNNREELRNKLEFYDDSKEEIINHDDIVLFNEYIRVMFQKYDYETAYVTILEYIKTGNVERITNTNNLRIRFIKNMSNTKCLKILGNLSLKEYIEKILNLENINTKIIELFNEYIMVMFEKYDYQTAYATISEYINTGNIDRITRTNYLRDRFRNSVDYEKLKQLIGNNLKSYIENVINNIFDKEKSKLDKIIIDTYLKYQDVEKVVIAINYACYGDYRSLVVNDIKNLDSKKIISLIEEYANGITFDYVVNCLKNYSLIDDNLKK